MMTAKKIYSIMKNYCDTILLITPQGTAIKSKVT